MTPDILIDPPLWVVRAMQEHAELVKRLTALQKFLADAAGSVLHQRTIARLRRQRDAMIAYEQSLLERIVDTYPEYANKQATPT